MSQSYFAKVFGSAAILVGLSQGGLAAEIRLRSECQVRGAAVTLGDAAEILSAAGDETSRLAAIELIPAPGPGRKRFLRAREIQDILAAQGHNLTQQRFSGASQVEVSRPVERTVRTPRRPTAAPAPRPVVETNVSPVVKAARPIARGSIVQAADLVIVEEKTRGANSGVVYAALEEVVGKEALQPIASGQTLDVGRVRPRVLVQRNDAVTVYSRSGGISVQTTGRAREAGAQGDLVLVESVLDRSTYFARVIGSQEVEVYAEGVAAGR